MTAVTVKMEAAVRSTLQLPCRRRLSVQFRDLLLFVSSSLWSRSITQPGRDSVNTLNQTLNMNCYHTSAPSCSATSSLCRPSCGA